MARITRKKVYYRASEDQGVSPAARDFLYLKEIETQCEFAIRSFGEIQERIESGRQDNLLFAFCHMFLVFAGNVTKLLFPLARASKKQRQRGERLRTCLRVGTTTPLRSRAARNYLEHFDERMERFIGTRNGVLVHRLVAAEEAAKVEIGTEGKLPVSYLQLFNTTTLELVFFDERVRLRPLYDELLSIQHNARETERSWPDARG